MLDVHRTDASRDTKTYFSHSILPAYIDPLNTSSKKKPFSTFAALPHSHTLDLVLPAELWAVVRAHLSHERVYARAFLSLSDVLSDDFLAAYVRQGNVNLLSSGHERGNTRFHVVQGVLRIDLDRRTYERAGLVGVPVEDGGKKHARARWRVEYDLRLPAARAGKKGFERLRWAAKNVLNESRSWLFYSANPSFSESVREGREVLSQHAPKVFELLPETTPLKDTLVPQLGVRENGISALYDQHDALALLEWLDLLRLGSSRTTQTDAVDGHLCRYDVPDFGHGVLARDLVRVRWSGFVTPEFVKDVFLAVWKGGFKGRREAKRRMGDARAGTGGDGNEDEDDNVTMQDPHDANTPEQWFAMSAQAFGGRKTWSLMQFADRETLVWDVEV